MNQRKVGERSQKRNEVYSELVENGIKPRKYFCPLTANFDYFKENGIDSVEKYNLKNASGIACRILCLPLYPDLEVAVVDNIISIIEELIMKHELDWKPVSPFDHGLSTTIRWYSETSK